MSDDQLISIEENGDYWLSKSNTAYHIINPNATNLTTIEANGYYSLAKGGDTYYVLDGNGNSTRLDDEDIANRIAPGNPTGPWSIIQVEATGPTLLGGEGYALLWHSPSFFYQQNNGYSASINDISGDQNALWNTSLANLESHFRVDLDANGSTTIKANQAYRSVDITGHQQHLDDGHGSDSIILKKNDVTIDPKSNPSWNVTQVEDSGTGYEVFWSHSSGRFEVWKVGASGNYESTVTAHLWQHEEKWGLDLNGDGDTGLQLVEAIGNVHLKHGDNTYNGAPQYYIVDGSNAPIGLTYGDRQKGPTDGGWNVTQVEDSGTGYEVFWARSSGRFEVWKVGASGNYESTVTAHLWQHEEKWGLDLNGDGDTGLQLVEAIGNVHLKHGDNTYNGAPQYYIVDGSNAPIGLTYGDRQKGPTDGGWNVTQVEDSGTGYEVFWARSSGQFEVWKVGASGNYESTVTAHLWQHEEKWGLDLNGDGDTGLQLVEAIGNVHLKHGDNTYNGAPQYYIVDGSNAPIGLTYGDRQKGPTDGGWNVTQVEDSGTGYEVFWSHSSGRFEVWKVGASGNYESTVTAHLWQHEEKWGLDLNGDGDTGLQLVEAIGNVHLKHGDNTYNGAPQYYIVDGSNAPIGLTYGDRQKGPTDGGWNVTQVEDSGTGYEVFWARSSGQFEVWKVGASGNYESTVTAHLWQHEEKWGLDLNGDGDTGLQLVEAIGNVHLKHGDNTYNGAPQYYIVDGSNAPIGLTYGDRQKGPTDGGWNVTQVEDSGTGYEVFWSHSSGRFEVWKVGASGNYESTVTAHLWQHEKTFKVDLNGDGIDSGNNNIYGSIGNDTFDGGAGDDIINGREGHDTLIGGEGNDWISGDGGSGYAGNDILFGNAGNDDLRGRDGNDQIDGGTGSDIIRTGSGSDKIILRIGDGGNTLADADIITDFTDGSDKLRLDGGLLFSQLVIDQGSGAYASDTIISKGTEYLAILQGIDIIQLSDADFETVDIA